MGDLIKCRYSVSDICMSGLESYGREHQKRVKPYLQTNLSALPFQPNKLKLNLWVNPGKVLSAGTIPSLKQKKKKKV